MRAVVLTDRGGPEVLQIAEVANPVAGPDEIVVDVVATAMNRADLLVRMGLYPGPKSDSEIPGLEYSGKVSEIGSRVSQWEVGDEVIGIVGGGSYAEKLVTHERQAILAPKSLSLRDASAIPEVFITAFDALVVQGGLRPGGSALVHAGGSGIGTASIQIAKALGACIVVTASAGKCQRCLDLGADEAVDYAVDDFVERARSLSGVGVDVVLDVIGGEYLDRNIDSLRVGGRIIQVGVMGAAKAEINLSKLLPKRATITGTVLRARPLEEKILLSRRVAKEVMPWFDDGKAVPVIDSRYRLDDIVEAHRYMETNANFGKILIDV
ncbi:MAG: NAD(P)H-quinone oxidoreductase [Acidimicrobiales bacterium]